MTTKFEPGETVTESGIYTAVHDACHVNRHEVTCLQDEVFPACRGCGSKVRFNLIRPAKHISEHPLFK